MVENQTPRLIATESICSMDGMDGMDGMDSMDGMDNKCRLNPLVLDFVGAAARAP